MKVSFLVTFYNQEQYVKEALDSILAIEKPFEWEILAGDDGSSDHTADVIREYVQNDPEHIHLSVMDRDPKIKYDPILRAGALRLHLLEKSKGEYFCILDGDDFYCDREWVREGIRIFENDPGLAAVAFSYAHYRNQAFEKTNVRMKEGRLMAEEYIARYYVPAGACLMKNIFTAEDVEKMKKTGAFDDNTILLACLRDGDIRHIARDVYAYRMVDESSWHMTDQINRDFTNAIDYYVLKRYSPTRTDAIEKRQFRALYHTYRNREKLADTVSETKKKLAAHMLEEGDELLDLLKYSQLNEEEKKRCDQAFQALFRRQPLSYLKAWIVSVLKK